MSFKNVFVVQITDETTLRAAREEDLKACGLKVSEIIKIGKALQQDDGCTSSEKENESDLTDISLLESSSTSATASEFSEHSYDHMDVDESNQVCCMKDRLSF